MTIRQKLYSIVAVVVIALAAIGGSAIWGLNQVNEVSSTVAYNHMPKVSRSGAIAAGVANYRLSQYLHVSSDDPAVKQTQEQSMENYRLQLKEHGDYLEQHFASQVAKDKLAELRAEWAEYIKSAEHIRTISRSGNREEAMRLLMAERDAYVAIMEDTDQLDKIITDAAAAAATSGDDLYASFSTAFAIVIVVLVLGVSAFIVTFIKNFTMRLNIFIDNLDKVAKGDLSVDVRVLKNDELGKMAESIITMINALRHLVTEIQKTASQVAASSEEMTASTDQSAEVTQSVAQSVTKVAEMTQNQSKLLDSTENIVGAVTDDVHTAMDKTNMAGKAIEGTVQKAKEGSKKAMDTIEKMHGIQITVEESAATVTKLGERSQEIGQIVDTISGIASQTNLLALNAAIEAARAGEHGKGFAVVAEEVRKLAEQSQEAAEHIASLIREIQTDTDSAVIAMNKGTEEVKNGTTAVSDTGKSFMDIVQMTEMVAEQAGIVVTTMQKITKGADDISSAVHDVDSSASEVAAESETISAAAEEQSASMEEIAAASRSLATMAQDLQDIVAKFRL